METGIERVKGAFSDNPVYDELMYKLAELSARWRGSKEPALVTSYQHVLLTLIEPGWSGSGHDALDVELELPDSLMPPEYFQLFEKTSEPSIK